MKFCATLLLLSLSFCAVSYGGNFDARQVFGFAPGHDVDYAMKRAAKDKKSVLLFTYDPKEGDGWPGFDITCFMDQEETRKIVKSKFIVVVLERGHDDLKRFPSPGAPDKAYYALISASGKVIKTDTVYRNGTEGLRVIKRLAGGLP